MFSLFSKKARPLTSRAPTSRPPNNTRRNNRISGNAVPGGLGTGLFKAANSTGIVQGRGANLNTFKRGKLHDAWIQLEVDYLNAADAANLEPIEERITTALQAATTAGDRQALAVSDIRLALIYYKAFYTRARDMAMRRGNIPPGFNVESDREIESVLSAVKHHISSALAASMMSDAVDAVREVERKAGAEPAWSYEMLLATQQRDMAELAEIQSKPVVAPAHIAWRGKFPGTSAAGGRRNRTKRQRKNKRSYK